MNDTVTRTCLNCQQPFPSKGPHNRICSLCKHHNAGKGKARYRISQPRRLKGPSPG